MVTAVGYVHALTGLAYEFPPLFVVPVLVVSWFLGSRFGYAVFCWRLSNGSWPTACWPAKRPRSCRCSSIRSCVWRSSSVAPGWSAASATCWSGVAAGPRRCLDPPAQPARVP